jgi:uncharacterized membrane protein
MTDNSHHGAFGADTFGRRAEAFARFFGTPKFLIGQSLFVVAWITINAIGFVYQWDPYPFILLNLAFSTQAAYAAPLILLAQTRQADRDKMQAQMLEAHRDAAAQADERLEQRLAALLEENTRLTREIHTHLTRER